MTTHTKNLTDAFDAAEDHIAAARTMSEFVLARLRISQLFDLWEQCFDERHAHVRAQQVAAALLGLLDACPAIEPTCDSEVDDA